MKTMKTIFALVVTAFAALAGVVSLGRAKAAAPTAHEWPMTRTELVAQQGVQDKVDHLQDEIARVSSGDQVLAQRIVNLALYLRAIDRSQEEVLREARARIHLDDVALAQSGTSWVVQPPAK